MAASGDILYPRGLPGHQHSGPRGLRCGGESTRSGLNINPTRPMGIGLFSVWARDDFPKSAVKNHPSGILLGDPGGRETQFFSSFRGQADLGAQ